MIVGDFLTLGIYIDATIRFVIVTVAFIMLWSVLALEHGSIRLLFVDFSCENRFFL